ncbi:hypothetical protein [Candidatus Bealeia paramacronuclearis]|uniref:hypothetical protein n=1 Tax=Candidatus Bealeia paramacronuclearis TaxID=1921001 RepID=UPI002F2625C3
MKDDLKLFDPLAHTQQLVFKSIKLAFGGFEQPPHHEDWEMRPVASPYIILTAKPKLTLRLEKNFSGLNVIATQGPWDYKLGTMNEDNITAGVQKLLSGLTHATDKTWIPAYVGILTNEKVFNVLALGIAMEIHSQYNIYKTQGHFKNRLPIPTIEDWERARVKSVLHHYDLYIQGLESKKEVF